MSNIKMQKGVSSGDSVEDISNNWLPQKYLHSHKTISFQYYTHVISRNSISNP